MTDSWLFVDDQTVPFRVNKFDGANAFKAGQCLDHFNGIMGLSNAGEMDVSIAVLLLEVLLGSIPCDADRLRLKKLPIS